MTGLPSFEYPLNSLRINLCSTSAAAKTEAFIHTQSQLGPLKTYHFFNRGEEGDRRSTILSHGERVGSGIPAHFISLGEGGEWKTYHFISWEREWGV